MTKHKYYKHLVFRETPYSSTKGRNPISEEMAMKENHFKLNYDDADRLVKIEYRIGEQLISPGRIALMGAMYDVAPSVHIKYSGNLEIRHFFDEEGKQITNRMNVYKTVYEYNDAGERIGLRHFDKEDKPTNSTWGIFEYTWKKVSKDSILGQRKNIDGEPVSIRPYYMFMNTLYTYDKNGMLLSMKNVDSSGELVEEKTGIAVDAPVYDEHFQLTGFKFYNKNEEHVVGSFYPCASGEIEYDAKGNVTKYVTMDLEGKPMLTSQQCAITECDFDKYGNLTEIRHCDEKGMPAKISTPNREKDFSKIQFIYDENNITLKPERVFI